MSVSAYLRENLGSISSKNVSVAPGIDEKKLNNALKAFAYNGLPGNVVALFDNTLFGTAKDGLLFTGEQVIYRSGFADPIHFPYEGIRSAKYTQMHTGSMDKLEHALIIERKDNSQLVIKDLSDCDYAALASVLQGVIENFTDFQDEKQLIPLEEMDEAVKVAYLKVIVNMAYDNDEVIDEKEFAEILLLMTRLDLEPESRFTVRAYMTGFNQAAPLEALLAELDSHCPRGQIRPLHISLTKDLINLYFSTGGSSLDTFGFLQRNRALLQVTDDEIDLAVAAIRNDHSMLKDDVTDDQIVSALKLLSAKAAAVGTPLAAVYLSGSVVGMSAAGLSSGLATLGMGGILGLSGMTAGIGVAVLLGVGAYTGMRKLTGADELTRSKRRELMLVEVIKQTQATISLLMQDLNHITDRLNQALAEHGEQGQMIQRVTAMMRQMTGAGTVLTNKCEATQSSATKLSCARFLDDAKLKTLTKEPTKAELYDFIRSFYEERSFSQEKDGQQIETLKLAIKPGVSPKALENLARAFEAVGYFNVSDVLVGGAADIADKAKGKLLGLFS
ncbi:hypothetical protein [Pseudomonas auratipiscis]|uniref:Uncharacterized protein n=1 Tax=Pseudomonas auratipiscis TaxID=3115853 RepID=A0AB35WWF2_9PSED|nr:MULTISPECIES: hypothetical protein [unclassified Pseudomonas]MEE1868471.1 hypothetical protein [Pseudomonas sp. 120P]MEE1960854.1 hypothetical protein [Pseudomonas sp. 119P]